jgi:hypothetical protein
VSGAQPTNAVNATGPATGSSYVTREINVTFTLGEGTFGQSGMNTATVSGLKVVANISKRGLPAMDVASLRVYGLTPSLMNQLSTLGIPNIMYRANNTVTIDAGDAVNGLGTVYTGSIQWAYQKLDQPETFLQVQAFYGMGSAMVPVTPTSFPGGFDVATAMQGFATKLGLAFENNGVQIMMPPSYFAGTYRDQIAKVAKQANIEAYIDSKGSNSKGGFPTLAIWPKSGTRNGDVPLIQASSGLIGYPNWDQYGITFRTIYNPSIRLGGVVQVNSTLYPPSNASLTSALSPEAAKALQAAGPNGYWYVRKLDLSLASQAPGGPWFCDCTATRAATSPVPQ